jgi:hypothetical protein
MPRLVGSASKGRLIYLVSEAKCIVEPIWLYTHEEYDSRPPDLSLRDAFRNAMDAAAEFFDKNETIRIKQLDGTETDIKVKIERKEFP